MTTNPQLTVQDMLQAAEEYLEQTETYEAVTQKRPCRIFGH